MKIVFLLFHMQLLSSDDQKLLRVSRAIGDLRLGMPIHLPGGYIALSLEVVNQQVFERITDFLDPILVLPSCKIHQYSEGEELVSIDLQNQSFESIKEFCSGKKLDISGLRLTNIDNIVAKLGIDLVKIAELLPIMLMFKINNGVDKLDNISHLEYADVNHHIKHVSNSLDLVSEANLNLRYASNAKILSFRSKFIGQDHYAIIVGDISKIDVPSVRIHSSCYTGDLMASLSCDCRDQLLETIKYMGSSEEKAGIIIYLLQEGRGIGLTNKIRTYKLQQEGQDTVEANQSLGFEEDERVFDAAAVILNKLDITKVNLLTNNPAKIKFLEDKNIKICKTISLFGEVNKYNRAYLETKKSRMGHVL